jgi:hypothetical protein
MYRLSAEWLPYDGAVFDGVFCMAATRNHAALANVDHVHDADDKVVARTSSLLLFVEPVDQVFFDVGTEKGGVQGDDFGFLLEEKHL